MTQEALKLALDSLEKLACLGNGQLHGNSIGNDIAKEAITAIKEALAQTQEPVAWQWLDTAHFRKKLPKDAGDGVWNPLYAMPTQCNRCKQLEEQAYDLVGKLRVANIKLSMQPQRTWVGLTVEEIAACCRESTTTQLSFAQELEAKLKEKNSA